MIAIITNLIKEGDRIRVFVSFEDDTEQTLVFMPEADEKEITGKIKEIKAEKEALIKKVDNLKGLIGLKI